MKVIRKYYQCYAPHSIERLIFRNLSENPLRCDCHLAAVMKTFMEGKRQSVFSSSGATCARDSKEFPDAVAAEVLGLLYCPRKFDF